MPRLLPKYQNRNEKLLNEHTKVARELCVVVSSLRELLPTWVYRQAMSTTLVSAFYDLGDVIFKNNNNNSRMHLKADRKVVGTPANYTRRNSNSNSTSANSLNSKLMNSNSTLISYNDSSINVSNNRENRRLDRSLSEPTDRSNSQHKNNQANSSRYKTELCRPYEENGTCKYGDKCQFAHGAHELRTLARHPKYKTELCRTYHTIGFCPYGPRCHFIHNADDKIQSPPLSRENTPRPKALSTGGFSLGSGADSPPSSVCGDNSPPSLSPTFFSDDPFSGFVTIPSPTNPTANNAFTFTQDFPSLMTPIKIQTQQGFNMNRVHHYNMLNQRNLNEGDCVFRESIIVPDAPPSPTDSICDLDNACMNGITCCGPLDGGRLPIFTRISTSED